MPGNSERGTPPTRLSRESAWLYEGPPASLMTSGGFYSNRDMAPQWTNPPDQSHFYDVVRVATGPPPEVEPFVHRVIGQQRREEWADFEDELESMRAHPGPFQDTRM